MNYKDINSMCDLELDHDEQVIYDKLISEINRGMRFQNSQIEYTIELLDSLVEALKERGVND